MYIHSHTHLPMVMKQGFYRTCEANRNVAPVSKLFVSTAALNTMGDTGKSRVQTNQQGLACNLPGRT